MAAIEAVESRARAAGERSLACVLPLYALGIAGLLRDSWPGAVYLPHVNLHAIFGALLWLLVVAQFRLASLAGLALHDAGLRKVRRGLSRRVYLLLYVLFGASQLIRVAAIVWNSGTPVHPAILTSPENLRDYLAYGVFALLTIHVLAALQLRRANACWRASSLGVLAAQRLPATSTTNESGISAGRGCGCSAVAAGAGPKSAVTR